MYKHLMIDIETLGDRSNSVITSIAAAPFNPDCTKAIPSTEVFYQKIHIQSSLDIGMNVTGSTLIWWLEQKPAAVQEMLQDALPAAKVIQMFWSYFKNLKNDEIKVWCKGARFDFGLLHDYFNRCGMTTPWHFWLERDLRGFIDLYPDVKHYSQRGIQHSAIDDVRHQINQLQYIAKQLNKVGLSI